MPPSHMGDLKRTLVEVILVYLVVDFATDVAEAAHLSWASLILPIATVLMAAALRILPGHRASADRDSATGSRVRPSGL